MLERLPVVRCNIPEFRRSSSLYVEFYGKWPATETVSYLRMDRAKASRGFRRRRASLPRRRPRPHLRPSLPVGRAAHHSQQSRLRNGRAADNGTPGGATGQRQPPVAMAAEGHRVCGRILSGFLLLERLSLNALLINVTIYYSSALKNAHVTTQQLPFSLVAIVTTSVRHVIFSLHFVSACSCARRKSRKALDALSYSFVGNLLRQDKKNISVVITPQIFSIYVFQWVSASPAKYNNQTHPTQ